MSNPVPEKLRQISDSLHEASLAWAPCFIEQQFPVAKVSMESYKERKANYGQTLTGLGKWWGRKPLVLVRAALIGLLMPVSDDPLRDREIFLKLMTMDEEGLWRRKNKSIPQDRLLEKLLEMPYSVRESFLDSAAPEDKPRLRDLSRSDRQELQRIVFNHLPYSQKLEYCCRPEQIDGPSPEAWGGINAHLNTKASSLQELVQELALRRFGHRLRVGDSFCGAGSVPFEAARLGCDAYGSDLSPVAALLTWAALNIVGGGEEVVHEVHETQQKIFESVEHKVKEWGIEQNELGWRADAYIYCVEVRDPESGWMVPLAPSWVIGEKTRTVAKLVPDPKHKRYEIEIREGASDEEMKTASLSGTVKDSRLFPPDGSHSTPIEVIRHNLRMWENDDLVPRPEDVFQERLYCIRWMETYYEKKVGKKTIELSKSEAEALPHFRELIESRKLKAKTRRHYRAPDNVDLKREQKVLKLLKERFREWQANGYIPNRRIEPGDETTRLQRERGWTHWHHLFTPRQLLLNGLFLETFDGINPLKELQKGILLINISNVADYNSKLSRVHTSADNEGIVENALYNQALNTLYNFGSRPLLKIHNVFKGNISKTITYGLSKVEPSDARNVSPPCDIWITDPPYADAINYHELSEFYLAWYEKHLLKLFPDWYTDSKRALAVKGNDENFRQAMVECYKRLVEHMPDNGLQVVMFTHQDAAVWADLTMILWAAGLRVTAAWCIVTETAHKKGNYVQGTVLLICRRRSDEAPVFLDEIAHRVETEVKEQLNSMLALEDDSDPNFGDADYQLAAYAAALRVLTKSPIEEINPAKEILRERKPGEIAPVEQLIRNAVKIACDHLVPRGIDRDLWKTLTSMERFYLKGLDVESHGEYRSGVYQELARGFGANNYTDLLASTKANETRLKTASELGRRMLSGGGFGESLVRHVLFGVHQVVGSEQARDGLNWLKTELSDYWGSREKIIQILDFIVSLGHVSSMNQWRKDTEAAELLVGAVRNDHV